ncbi:MAG: cbb3-type cytochrome c oxidase subunit I [Deltaproteobacteria bacterium]|nr:cbb3-type cytochrome c oxidase subunit I [Deltaproteobacteria bacterium]
MAILGFLSAQAYRDAPPVPERVVDPAGGVLFTGADILAGQQVFLRYGLMENGSIWGHGAYLGPDYSAQYLHWLAEDAAETLAPALTGHALAEASPAERSAIDAQLKVLLKANRYSPEAKTLVFTEPEAKSYAGQVRRWAEFFQRPAGNGGLSPRYISDPEELRLLTAFFAWAAWASVATRPGTTHSYTNNFPYDLAVGNTPTAETLLWSMLSIIMLLGGTALVLFAFGRFDFLGWKGETEVLRLPIEPERPTESQRAAVKYFLLVAVLFLAQTLAGGAIAHYRAEPSSFYGLDLARVFPSNILRTWHLQLAIFWIATAYLGGALFLAPMIGGGDPPRQALGVNVLFWALVAVVAGSLLGEFLGIRQLLGRTWFWLGHQGWEYLDLGRLWQFLLTAGLLFWLFLLLRAVSPARRDPERRELSWLFVGGAAAIPVFYVPAFLFDSVSNYAVVDMWRFWIIHLWVEGFFEIFVTVMVALLFFQMGLVSRATATRVIYLDAILFLAGGIVGTAHHWYWTGQSSMAMAFAAMYSALEVVPLTLLTLDAGDFLKISGTRCESCGKAAANPYRWTFYFLMATGFWNFVGAGIFGFLINLPIVSFFEVGTMLTPNHGHSALMGAFGMLAVALVVLGLRHVSSEAEWRRPERYVKVAFLGLNGGLGLMVLTSLFPGGVLQLKDVLENGYWHARATSYLDQGFVRLVEWMRMPADLVFIFAGVVPLCIAAGLVFRSQRGRTVSRAGGP